MDDDFDLTIPQQKNSAEKDKSLLQEKEPIKKSPEILPDEALESAVQGYSVQSKNNIPQDVIKKPNSMAPIMDKMDRYFGEYEFGVYKEEANGKDGAVWKVSPSEKSINYLKAMNFQGKHIFVRPSFKNEDRFMMHDDLNKKGLEKYHMQNGQYKPGRMVVESSPGNYQVWIKSDRPLTIEEKTHWLKKMDSDPGASPLHRWGRSPGFRNRKKKYQTEKGYPLARTVWVDWKNQAHVPKVEIKTEPVKNQISVNSQPLKFTKLNHGQLPTRADYYKGTDSKGKALESEQDFAYAMALLRREVPKDQVMQRIRIERTDWSNHKGPKRQEAYLTRTVDRAENKVLCSPGFTRKQTKQGQGKAKDKSQTSDYAITIKDTKKKTEKVLTLKNIPKNNAENTLRHSANKAVASMGYQDTSDLEVKIQKIQRSKNKTMSKQLNLEA